METEKGIKVALEYNVKALPQWKKTQDLIALEDRKKRKNCLYAEKNSSLLKAKEKIRF
jgi:hypothetical protein